VTGFNHPDAATIRPGWAGERFDLHECVQALFRMRLPDQEQEAASDSGSARNVEFAGDRGGDQRLAPLTEERNLARDD
jgi:hypothetical protein